MDVMSGLENRLWWRIAAVLMAVGLIMTIGKWLPLPGLFEGFRELVLYCGHSGGLIQIGLGYTCPGPMLLHNELAGSAFLGVAALIAVVVVSVRRRLTS